MRAATGQRWIRRRDTHTITPTNPNESQRINESAKLLALAGIAA
jgi:hypothetical protein